MIYKIKNFHFFYLLSASTLLSIPDIKPNFMHKSFASLSALVFLFFFASVIRYLIVSISDLSLS